MPNKSCIDFLVEKLIVENIISGDRLMTDDNYRKKCDLAIQQARAMHREEVEEAFSDGYAAGYYDTHKEATDYYNKKYGK